MKNEPSSEELKHDIIVQVERGAMSPKSAELKAREMGLGSFSQSPNPATFSAMEQDVWSLDMALAWIIWRTPERVEEYWHDSQAKRWGWQPIKRSQQVHGFRPPRKPDFGPPKEQAISGHQLVPFRQRNIFSELASHQILVDGETPKPEAGERLGHIAAEKTLRSALIHSQLIASARKCSTEEIVDIPTREWPLLQYDTSTETELFIPPAKIYEPEEVDILYREVTVLKNDVVRLWSETGPDYRTGEFVENPRKEETVIEEESTADEKNTIEYRYKEWLRQKPNSQQVVGRFLLEEWELDIRPVTDGSRYNAVSLFAVTLGASPPSEKTISRFIKSAKTWLQENRE
jgi:hypothetical protein